MSDDNPFKRRHAWRVNEEDERDDTDVQSYDCFVEKYNLHGREPMYRLCQYERLVLDLEKELGYKPGSQG